ncbi:MAG TPA: cupin domain-containing protein [Ktedonobacteraceae bacterium]|nr:cupin domain-containing protein [Ktedonobacteraceae bacterium]
MSETPATTTESSATTQQRHAARTAPGEGQAYWFFGALAVIRSPEGARPIVIEMTVPPGGHTPLHVHTNLDDSFYLLSGRMAIRSGDETFVAYAGDYVSQPTGVPQTFFALDEKPAILLQTHANDDFLNYIRLVGAPAEDGTQPPDQPLDFDYLYKAAAATGQPVIGPPMTEDEAAIIASAAAR